MQDESKKLRLNKLLALELGVSRREADNLIAKGVVVVDGTPATLGARVEEDSDITVSGAPLTRGQAMQYIALNKPVGYVCSRKRQGDNPTIYELLPNKLHKLKPVGRLDKDSSGLLLLSNDGDFTLRMTHPRFSKVKIYEVSLDKELEPLHQQMINDFGVQLEDGVSQLGLARLSDDERFSWQITMSEGRNRQIRRTFSALGYTVTKLHRTQFGSYALGDIKPGDFEAVDMR